MADWSKLNVWVVGVLLVVGGCSDSGPNGTSCPSGTKLDETSGKCVGPDVRSAPTDSSFLDDAGPTALDVDVSDPWGDGDKDGVFNHVDNCPKTPNKAQKDRDKDGVGDQCDNCPGIANYQQKETDPKTKRGDACDEIGERYKPNRNSDSDKHVDVDDNCPQTDNPGQTDSDGDHIGDACDNCPMTSNPTQKDSNNDQTGDSCSRQPTGPVCKKLQSDFERFTPNIYFLLDKSGSMKGNKMNDAKRAIVDVARKYEAQSRFGLTAFSSDCDPDELLRMGKHNAASVQNSFSRVVATGQTGTGGALASVRTEKRYLGPNEGIGNKRPKAVLIVTDGKANVCGGLSKATSEASTLKSKGIKTYVVGFKSDASPGKLDAIAQAGGTGNHVKASNSMQLTQAVSNIFQKVIPCSFKLPQPSQGIDPNKIWVKIDGKWISRSEFSYDSSSQKLKLNQSACKKLLNASAGPLSDPIEVVMGCPDDCQKNKEICDYKDNNCDGKVDPNCEGCGPEICDGKDNDCDGARDEKCPPCYLVGQSCMSSSNCCGKTVCRMGKCRVTCRPTGVTCSSNDECCSGTCAGSGPDAVCVGE